MAFTVRIPLALGSAQAGIADDLRAQLVDDAGSSIGLPQSGAIALLESGNYIMSITAADGWAGYARIYSATDSALIVAPVVVSAPTEIADAVLAREHALTPAAGTLGYLVEKFMSMTETAGASRKWTNAALAEIFTRLDVAVSTRLASADYTLLPGPFTATITFTDDVTLAALVGVRVIIRDEASAAIVGYGYSDSAGEVVMALTAGTFRIIATLAGYFFPSPTFGIIDADVTPAVAGTAAGLPPAPGFPGDCRLSLYVGGQSVADAYAAGEITAWAEIIDLPYESGGRFYSGQRIAGTLDVARQELWWEIVQGARIKLTAHFQGIDDKIIIPEAANADASTLIGA